jgi:hypothetical protein
LLEVLADDVKLTDLVRTDTGHHLGAPEVDRPSASKRSGVLDEHDLLVHPKPLQDLLGLDETARDLLLAARLVPGV